MKELLVDGKEFPIEILDSELQKLIAPSKQIGCRKCDSPYCDGCNLKTLETMLEKGKFDCIKDSHHSIKPTADVVEVRHGEWIEHRGQSYLVHPMKYDENGPILQDYVNYECSECGRTESKKEPYCNCGAKMDGETK